MSSGVQPGDGYSVNTLNGVSSISVDKTYTNDNNPGVLVGVVLPKIIFPDVVGPQFPESLEKILQFEVQTLVVGNTQYVRVAQGAVNFTVSNMPEVWKGVAYDDRQAWISRVAVRPGITVVNGGDAGSPWMEDGGYYSMPAAGQYYVVISKLDVAGSTSSSTLLQQNVPFVSIFRSTDALYDKIFSETGPSHYLNKTNVQKMAGYNAAATGLSGDFGNCHTTWFLPVKWGYACKIIAVIDTYTPPIVAPTISVVHAATATSSAVHRITLPPVPDMKKAGSFQLQYAPGFTSDTTDPFDPFNPLNSGNLSGQFQWNLANSLKAIQSLRGNSTVTVQAENKLDITYVGELANTAVPLPTIINNTIGVATTTYEVMQHVVGSIDMTSHPQFLGTTLMNEAGWVESEDDPYNEYEANDWNDISNFEQKDAIEGIAAATTNYYELMLSPNDWTSQNYSWIIPGTCSNDAGNGGHPFLVTVVASSGGMTTYKIQSGTVNNVVPGNINSEITVSTGDFVVWLKVPYLAPDFPDATDFEWDLGTPLPTDTDEEGYVKIAEVNGTTVTQFVTGSLWADRIKLGEGTATYYYARI
jgi:hypothetical protein